MNIQQHKRIVRAQASAIGLRVSEGLFKYHQQIELEQERVMLVVPWPGSPNYAINELDWERNGTHMVQFGSLTPSGRLRLDGCVHQDDIRQNWESFQSFQRYQDKRSSCRVIPTTFVQSRSLT